jgi:hypothetical protein
VSTPRSGSLLIGCSNSLTRLKLRLTTGTVSITTDSGSLVGLLLVILSSGNAGLVECLEATNKALDEEKIARQAAKQEFWVVRESNAPLARDL